MGIPRIIEDVLHHPEVPYNLLSVKKIQKSGIVNAFSEGGVTMNKGGKTVIKGT